MHPSLEQCGGRVGRYDERTNELVLCRIDQETALHELAHAWIDRNLDTDQRAQFVQLRDLPQWNDRTQEWADRGSEQAAEILLWALSDQDRTVSWIESSVKTRRLLSIDNSSPEALTTGFQLMTGHQPTKRNISTPAATVLNPEAQRTTANTNATAFSPELGR